MDNNKAEHIVLYMNAKFLLRWKRIVLIPKNPLFIYGSKSNIFGKRIGEDFTTLWVISPVARYQHPALIAKMKVKNVAKLENGKICPELNIPKEILKEFVERKDKWIITASEKQSVYFGYNDAGDALLDTSFGLVKPKTLKQRGKEWKSSFGSFFQGPRIVYQEKTDEGGTPGIKHLADLAKNASRSVFISYKWCDDVEKKAIALAYALAELDIMPWLDRLAFPRADYSKELRQDSYKLEKLLRYGYNQCAAVIAFGTKNYGEITNNGKENSKNWTEREWIGELSDNKKPYRFLIPQTGHKKSGLFKNFKEDKKLDSEDLKKAAQEIKEGLDSM